MLYDNLRLTQTSMTLINISIANLIPDFPILPPGGWEADQHNSTQLACISHESQPPNGDLETKSENIYASRRFVSRWNWLLGLYGPVLNTFLKASMTEDKMAPGSHRSLRWGSWRSWAEWADKWREGTGRPPPPGLPTKPGTPMWLLWLETWSISAIWGGIGENRFMPHINWHLL